MFYLNNTSKPDKLSDETLRRISEVTSDARQRLEDSSVGLKFDQEQHRYFFYGNEMASVSSIVEKYAPFDTEKVALACSRNPRHEHFGKSVWEIIDIWNAKKEMAADLGTKTHAFAEACCLYRLGLQDEIDDEFHERITSQGLEAKTSKEEAVARFWQELDLNEYAFVAKETQIVNFQYRYAGTFDLLLYDIRNDRFCLKDYKTNENLYKSSSDKLKAPLNNIRANEIGKYTLQQNLYMIQLHNIGIPVADIQLIWLTDDSYRTVDIDVNYEKQIRYALSVNS